MARTKRAECAGGTGPAEAGHPVRSGEPRGDVGELADVASAFRRTFGAGVVVIALLMPAVSAAQSTNGDARWHAWTGCWTGAPSSLADGPRSVCVVPAAGTSAVDIVTVANGRVASREHIEASGERRTTERDGCSGWEAARWSADGRRVYLESEHQCATGGKRSSGGLISMSPEGEWLDIVSVTLAGHTGVRVLRHRPLADSGRLALPADVTAALRGVPASSIANARVAAIAPVGSADIVDASHHVDSAVVSAWLNDVRQPIAVDAKRLVELADAGVPGPVIDMMVALAYPTAFSVPPSPTTAGALTRDESRGGAGGGFDGVGGLDSICDRDFSLYAWGCSPFAATAFGFSAFGYLPYASSRGFWPYGDPGGYYGGGWYATAPTVLVIQPNAQAHGQVVNGRGYSSPGAPATATITEPPPAASSGGSSSGASSSGSSGSSGGGASSAPSSGGGDRTAQPR